MPNAYLRYILDTTSVKDAMKMITNKMKYTRELRKIVVGRLFCQNTDLLIISYYSLIR